MADPKTNAAMPREVWLLKLAGQLEATLFEQEMPPYRVTCGWPSRGGTAERKRTIGQCFCPTASSDGTAELIVSMWLDDPMDVAATLAHEMIHAIVGIKAGHKGPFRKLALEIGLEGKMTATYAGDTFKRVVQPILDSLGPYPHSKLDAKAGGKKQTTRLIKVECGCGYNVRITQKWLDEVGEPHCPLHGPMEVA